MKNRLVDNLVKKWSEKLGQKLKRKKEEIEEKGLSAYDFSPSTSVEILFHDKSCCKFNSAFCVIDEKKRLVAIFTEHCGYHEFFTYGAIIKEISEETFVDEDYET
jgi:hypothetical protein